MPAPTLSRTALLAQLADSPLRRIARHVLPISVKRRIVSLVYRAETRAPDPMRPLADCRPLLTPDHFATGPIIIVNNSLTAGGAERQVVNTIRGLVGRQKRPVGLLCLRLGYTPENDFYRPALEGTAAFARNTVALGEANDVLQALSRMEQNRIQRTIAWLPADTRDEVRRFLADFLMLRPVVVHVFQDHSSIAAGYAAAIAGVPRIVLSGRNMRPTNFEFYRPHWADAYRQLAACKRVAFVNNSAAGAADYDRWLGFAHGRVRVHRNGIDTAAIRRAPLQEIMALRQRLAIPATAPVVGSIYRFSEEKRPLLWVETATRIARTHPNAHFVVFGHGPVKQAFEKAARTAGISERLHVPGTIEDVGLALSCFDVFLLTSKFEGSPNVVIEAGMTGIPVVTTEAGGAQEAVQQGLTGYVAETASPDELADLVGRVLADADWRAQASRRAPEFIRQRFGMERMVAETLALYELPTTAARTGVA